MAQVTIYLDDETDRKARAAAAQAGQSVSAWVGGLIRNKVASEWPAGFFEDLAGAWRDDDAIQIEPNTTPDLPREEL